MCQSCVTTTFSNAPASLLMIGTTSSPPFTASVPPVTKQFCTSMTSSALLASGLTAAKANGAAPRPSKPATPTWRTKSLRCMLLIANLLMVESLRFLMHRSCRVGLRLPGRP